MRITVDPSQGNAELRRLAARLDHPRPFLKSWVTGVKSKAQANARAKGGRRFWQDFARHIVVTESTDVSATLLNDHYAAAIKEFGGVIKPVNKRALTIPIAPEARGKTAGEFETGGRKLFVLPKDRGDTIGLLGYADARKKFHPLFVLRTRSVQRPDPWMPTDSEQIALGLREAAFWVERQLK